ncbi:MAG: ribosome small subunit-dependent GTPase A [Pseudomonadota bacterium]|nr:ribosome small subunit-dependent GTPase A [Pseudomonadota bacterium]
MPRSERPRAAPPPRATPAVDTPEPGVWGDVVEMVGKRVRVRLDPDSQGGEGGEHILPVRAKVAISDRVRVHEGAVVAFAPRTAELMRSGEHKTQVVCANASLLVMVVAAREPPFRAGLIDRVLVAAGAAGMKAAIVLNKCDQGMPSEVLEKLARYEALGYPIFLVSAHQQKGLEPLIELLAQHTSVFVGHSGVGKTSLLQVIVPGVVRDIGVLDQWGRGRHTTIAAVRFDLPGGGRVIDVPGVREFGLEHIDREDLHLYFPELAELRCQYRDCMHMGEDGCGAEEVCEEDRLESYQKLVEELI